ncbi:M91 family zinc metallopeptidase [Fulvivirga sediminis]|uniref:Uncharacterized protein n=1 Tax=Fulvivirga sediminis TaxID=2803949 RepID=A0A937FDA0_9BACT|nr:M91 family zinc metallopeptidase [Fulvivirga sediminis]MBL3658423.1 hypothetical protein [Fulvivirga sediminis]
MSEILKNQIMENNQNVSDLSSMTKIGLERKGSTDSQASSSSSEYSVEIHPDLPYFRCRRNSDQDKREFRAYYAHLREVVADLLKIPIAKEAQELLNDLGEQRALKNTSLQDKSIVSITRSDGLGDMKNATAPRFSEAIDEIKKAYRNKESYGKGTASDVKLVDDFTKVTYFHEMMHALRNATGTAVADPDLTKHAKSNVFGGMGGDLAKDCAKMICMFQEEYEVIGLIKGPKVDGKNLPTDNDLRKELGVEIRQSYGPKINELQEIFESVKNIDDARQSMKTITSTLLEKITGKRPDMTLMDVCEELIKAPSVGKFTNLYNQNKIQECENLNNSRATSPAKRRSPSL